MTEILEKDPGFTLFHKGEILHFFVSHVWPSSFITFSEEEQLDARE